MNRWPIVPLLSTCHLISTRVDTFSGSRTYVSTGDVDSEIISTSQTITFDNRPTRADLVAEKDDILFARMQGTHKVILVTSDIKNYIWSTGFAILRPNFSIDGRWLLYWLRSRAFQDMKDTLCAGATQKAINNSAIAKLMVPLPPLPEQERTVKLLDYSDQLLRLRVEAEQRIADFIPALFNEYFGSQAQQHNSWKEARLEELCSTIVDCPHSTPTYSLVTTEYPCIRSSDIQNGRLDWSTTKYVNEREYQERVNRLVPCAGDVVFCREGARLGNAAIIPQGIRCCLGQRMMLFRARGGSATPEFIWALLNSPIMQQQITSLVGGSASPHLNVADIKSFIVEVPPCELQDDFSARVNEMVALESVQATSRRRLDDLFQSLLHRAFQGEL